MEIRTYVGTEFTISAVDENVQLRLFNLYGTYRGDLINPQDLRVLASIIEWGKEQGIELDFSID
jgi:hypothetical protein|tara:strand:- start:197 stop:388 length:192 start_codon:yes stop_codon:yes gene_type:complete